jgi:hypothetical protein
MNTYRQTEEWYDRLDAAERKASKLLEETSTLPPRVHDLARDVIWLCEHLEEHQ